MHEDGRRPRSPTRFGARTAGLHARRRAGLRRRGRRAGLAGPARQGARARRRRRGQGGPGGGRRASTGPTSATLFYEPTVLAGVTPDMARVPRGDVRAGGRRLPGRVRRRGGRPGQRHRVRAQRQRLLRRHRPREGDRRAAPGRHGQRQRRLLVRVGQPRRADGRHEGVGPRPPPRARRACSSTPSPRRSRCGRRWPPSCRTPAATAPATPGASPPSCARRSTSPADRRLIPPVPPVTGVGTARAGARTLRAGGGE